MPSPSLRVVLASALALLWSGCGYVHFGRLPEAARPVGEGKVADAVSSLSTENKILKQELTLARREGETLRRALERAGGTTAANPPPSSSDALARLSETTTELATLRASYAKLQAERSAAATPGSSAQLQALEEKLAATLRERTQLQTENLQLRGQIDVARRENATLAEKLQSATRQYDDAQFSLAQLNTELVAQKQARSRAEQATDALRTQLGAVVAQAASSGVSPLQIAKEPPAAASSGVELRTNTERLRQQAAAITPAEPAPPSARSIRKHTVQAGDTLEKLAQRYYGAPDRWRSIYDANSAVLANGQPLRAGTELAIPE